MKITLKYFGHSGSLLFTEEIDFVPPVHSTITTENIGYGADTNLFVVTSVKFHRQKSNYTCNIEAHHYDPKRLNPKLEELHNHLTT